MSDQICRGSPRTQHQEQHNPNSLLPDPRDIKNNLTAADTNNSSINKTSELLKATEEDQA